MSKKVLTKKDLDELNYSLFEYYKDQLESGEELSSGTLNAINGMLKNNNIKVATFDDDESSNLMKKIQDIMGEEVIDAEISDTKMLPESKEELKQAEDDFLNLLDKQI